MHCDNTCKQDPTRALIHLLLVILCTLSVSAHPLPDDLRNQAHQAAAPQIEAPASPPSTEQSMLQFTAGGHVLGFRTEEVWIASKDHVLQLTFEGANRVEPTSSQSTTGESQAQPLSQVTYHRLWQDIDLLYRTDESGLFQTEYLLRPGARVESIRLSSNVPASLDKQGGIVFAFESGEMRQAAPTAWQFIDNQKTSVPVTYNLVTTREIGFRLGKHDPAVPLAISLVLTWHTFLGATSMDSITGIVVLSADIYVTGTSEASWGSPLNPHSGGDDIFLAELDPEDGSLSWNTFFGGAGDDKAQEIVHDSNHYYGILYIIGESDTGWGTPVRAYSGGWDAFVTCVSVNPYEDCSGGSDWLTFLGSSGNDYGRGIYYDSNTEDLYITGFSDDGWGERPIHDHTGLFDSFVARIDTEYHGIEWNTFWGSTLSDRGMDIFVDAYGYVFYTGYSNASWQGSYPPNRAYSGGNDAFVAKLNVDGLLFWNTFLGSTGNDYGYGIAVGIQSDNQIFVVGSSTLSWQSASAPPVLPHNGGTDAFVANLDDSDGDLHWNSFLGSSGTDVARDLVLSTNSLSLYIVGDSTTAWGPNSSQYSGDQDVFFARVFAFNGTLEDNFFMGSELYDQGYAIARSSNNEPFIGGESKYTWGDPINECAGYDGFVAEIDPDEGVGWNNFLGGTSVDEGYGITRDGSGNIYVTGYSYKTWGGPYRAHQGKKDAFVAKLDRYGTKLWNTFLGSDQDDIGYGIQADSSGNVYVVGESNATWQGSSTPKRPYTGGPDAFVAKIDTHGSLQWNTFLGESLTDRAYDVDLVGAKTVHVVGYSNKEWGVPKQAYQGSGDAFAAELETDGDLVWNTFLGGAGGDSGKAIVVDSSDNVYIVGNRSSAAYVAKLNTNGVIQWENSFRSIWATGSGIALDSSSHVYITGETSSGWGTIIGSCSTYYDAFLAQLNVSDGEDVWMTCMGVIDGSQEDIGKDVDVGPNGHIYLVGISYGTWGEPVQPYAGDIDAWVAEYSSSGELIANTFQGSERYDSGNSIVVDADNWVYITGYSVANWGQPILTSGGCDAFVSMLSVRRIFLPIIWK